MNTMVMRRALLAALLSSLAFASLAESDIDVEAVVKKALAKEFLLMSRPMNEFERQVMSVNERMETQQSPLGAEFAAELAKDMGGMPIEHIRAPESLNLLNDAANLCGHKRNNELPDILGDLAGRAGLNVKNAREDELCKIAKERAVTRGDQMMALGFDKTVGLFFRESLMRHASEYYRIGEDVQKQSYAQNERRILGEEVQRAEGDRKVRLEAYQRELQPMIEEMQRGVQDMLKSDAEKRAFNEEADALEDELDF